MKNEIIEIKKMLNPNFRFNEKLINNVYTYRVVFSINYLKYYIFFFFLTENIFLSDIILTQFD